MSRITRGTCVGLGTVTCDRRSGRRFPPKVSRLLTHHSLKRTRSPILSIFTCSPVARLCCSRTSYGMGHITRPQSVKSPRKSIDVAHYGANVSEVDMVFLCRPRCWIFFTRNGTWLGKAHFVQHFLEGAQVLGGKTSNIKMVQPCTTSRQSFKDHRGDISSGVPALAIWLTQVGYKGLRHQHTDRAIQHAQRDRGSRLVGGKGGQPRGWAAPRVGSTPGARHQAWAAQAQSHTDQARRRTDSTCKRTELTMSSYATAALINST